jgi:hypothetical protein
MKTPRSTHTSSNDTLPIVGPLWIYRPIPTATIVAKQMMLPVTLNIRGV